MAQIDDFFMYENRVEGITDAAPSHNTRSVGQEKTKWYQATH